MGKGMGRGILALDTRQSPALRPERRPCEGCNASREIGDGARRGSWKLLLGATSIAMYASTGLSPTGRIYPDQVLSVHATLRCFTLCIASLCSHTSLSPLLPCNDFHLTPVLVHRPPACCLGDRSHLRPHFTILTLAFTSTACYEFYPDFQVIKSIQLLACALRSPDFRPSSGLTYHPSLSAKPAARSAWRIHLGIDCPRSCETRCTMK